MVLYIRSEVRLASARLPQNPKSFFLETPMSTNRSVDRSAVTHAKDRASLCSFTFSDGRRCRSPRRDSHPHLCTFHARKEAQALGGEEAGKDIAFFLSGEYVSAGDLTFALGRLFSAVAQGQVKPKTASPPSPFSAKRSSRASISPRMNTSAPSAPLPGKILSATISTSAATTSARLIRPPF
jgi:hypothetical protein